MTQKKESTVSKKVYISETTFIKLEALYRLLWDWKDWYYR